MTERTQHGSPEEDAAGERPRSRWGTIAAVAGAAVLFLAIVGAVTDMVIASGTEVRGGSSGGGPVDVQARNFAFIPSSVVVHGSSVILRITNDGVSAHSFTVDEPPVDVVVQSRRGAPAGSSSTAGSTSPTGCGGPSPSGDDRYDGPAISHTASRGRGGGAIMTRAVSSIIEGRARDGAPGGRLTIANPARLAHEVCEVLLGDAATFVEACRTARDAQRAWAAVPAPVRGSAVQQIGRLVEANKDALAGLITREIGKPYKESLGEVQEVMDTCTFFLGEGRRLYGQTVPSEMPDKQLFTFRQPMGVAAVITAGNFPGNNWDADNSKDQNLTAYHLEDNLTWVKGKHNLQIGGEAQHYNVQIRNEFKRDGHFQFNGSYTGNTLADFLLGYVSSLDVGTGEYKDYKVLYASGFVQDDFKVSPRVTLNLGFRLESSPPWHEIIGRIMKFTVADYNNNVHSTRFPAAPRGETFRGDPGFPEDGVSPSSLNPAPRVGFAWDMTGDGKTSLRGGGGMFFDQHRDGESGNNAADSPPWAIRVNPANPSTFGPVNQSPFHDVFFGRPDFALVNSTNIGTVLAPFPKPVVMDTYAANYYTPVTYNFNLMLEREVMSGLMVRAAYVGSRSRHGRMGWEMNYADKNIAGASTANTDARRLFAADGIGQISLQTQDRRSNYNSMQLTASRRYSHGFTVSGGYTLSKVVGNFGDQLIPYNQFQDPAHV